MAASESNSRSQVKRRLALLGAVAVVLVATPFAALAVAGGLRIRDPLASMEREVDRFDLDSAVVLSEKTERIGHHLCFLQCDDWRVEQHFTVVAEFSVKELCEVAKRSVADWGFPATVPDSPSARVPCRHRDQPGVVPYCRSAYVLDRKESLEIVAVVSDCA